VAEITVPSFLHGLRGLLLLRTAIATSQPPVPVYTIDRGSWRDPEAIVLSRVVMAGARWLGWGAGPDSHKTVEPLTLAGYAFANVAGSTPDDDERAWQRVGVLLGEVVQQLRDTPDLAGDIAPAVRYAPPRVDQAVWAAWSSGQEGTATVRARVDFRIAWQAIS
jgi:hypothetical protein